MLSYICVMNKAVHTLVGTSIRGVTLTEEIMDLFLTTATPDFTSYSSETKTREQEKLNELLGVDPSMEEFDDMYHEISMAFDKAFKESCQYYNKS